MRLNAFEENQDGLVQMCYTFPEQVYLIETLSQKSEEIISCFASMNEIS